MNSGRFVIVVTAVGANVGVDVNEDGEIADVHGPETDDRPPQRHHLSGRLSRLSHRRTADRGLSERPAKRLRASSL